MRQRHLLHVLARGMFSFMRMQKRTLGITGGQDGLWVRLMRGRKEAPEALRGAEEATWGWQGFQEVHAVLNESPMIAVGRRDEVFRNAGTYGKSLRGSASAE